MQLFLPIIRITLIIICFVMGIVFLTVPVQNDKQLKPYRISLKVLATAYIILALLFIVNTVSEIKCGAVPNFCDFPGLLVSYLQSLLFTFSLIIIINRNIVTKRKIALYAIPAFLFTVSYSMLSFFYTEPPLITTFATLIIYLHNPLLVTRLSFAVFYLAQLFYYMYLFFTAEAQCRVSISNYHSGSQINSIKSVRYLFIAASGMGVLAFFWVLLPWRLLDIFMVCFSCIFYLSFSIIYIRYPLIFSDIEPVLKEEVEKVEHDTILEESVSDISFSLNWEKHKIKIENSKIYLKPSITLEELALWLGTNRTTLSNTINGVERKNFNRWINSLRINEALRLMDEQPELPIAQISEQTGYSEPSNFGRQFKLITGTTPGQHKKTILTNA